jgi:CxxC motif-containing protein (DUF1111 family)
MGRTFRVLASGLACLWLISVTSSKVAGTVDEAPTGFDDQTNGFVGDAEFAGAKAVFEEVDTIEKGLGPVYNTQSCAECHQNPVSGGISQITELRAGHFNGTFVAPPGGSLINDRAVSAEIQERVPPGFEVRTFRTSLNTLGDGFVEVIDDQTLRNIANDQPASMRGLAIEVPIFETPGVTRVGRFGWKNQMASLLSFSSDAYLNEMGITNRFNLTENTSMGVFVGFGAPGNYDHVPDNQPCTLIPATICGEDKDDDISEFATFMRATKAPSRGPSTPAVLAGEVVFHNIGCATCHVASITTGTALPPHIMASGVNPAALLGKTIHPFGDFLLHNIGTGDGIVQNGGPATRNRMRTAPLWGVRTRDRLMHDGLSLTFEEAIFRHGGEALGSTLRFVLQLNNTQRNNLIAFLRSL